MLIECAKGEKEGVRGPRAFVDIYRERERERNRATLALSKRDRISRKKALACGWQIGVSPRRRLEEYGMSTRVDGFPAGKHDGRVCAHTRAGPTRQSAKIPSFLSEKGNRRQCDEKGGRFIYVSLFPTTERKNTPTRGEINFSNSGVWRKESKK